MAFDFGSLLKSLGTKIADSFDPIGIFHSGDSGATGDQLSLANFWDKLKNGTTNDVNYKTALENLAFQRERADIEDSRYEDETAYNREWAEEERDYQRALQERIFEREDTAIERQAKQLSNLGINPLSQQLNGLGAGTPVSAAAPSVSGRVAVTPQNAFQMLPNGIMDILSPIASLASTFNGIETGQYQRDALALQNDKQFLENLSRANELGIEYKGLFPAQMYHKGYIDQAKKGYETTVTLPSGENLFDTPEFKSASFSGYRKSKKDSMLPWQFTLDQLANDNSVYSSAEKTLTKAAKLWETSTDKLFGESIFDLGKGANGKFNPINFLMSLLGI